MTSKFYITTPLYYVNASPHVGHSYTTIAADCLARMKRQELGYDNVWLLTGTDEHGQKIQRAAQALGLSPLAFSDVMVGHFKTLWEALSISFNDFIRTTEDRHIRTVRKVLELLYEKGQIYPAEYEGWYCTPCETFWTEMQLKEGNCPDCARTVEKIRETNYFFKLAMHQKWLLAYLKENPKFILPEHRMREVESFLELNTLTDLCISRPKERLNWGIPLPFSAEHVTYVWFDALINYISAVGEFDEKGKYHSRWWPAQVQLIGKDILRQHAVYWPIILHALGLELPKTIFAHGWWLLSDTKMSKSRGNVVSPIDMVNTYGLDVYRYFLLRDVPFGLDGNFSEEAIVKRFNSDLANDLGNLLYRTLTMIEKYYGGQIPRLDIQGRVFEEEGEKIKEKMFLISPRKGSAWLESSDFNFSARLEEVWQLIGMANKYVEVKKPWNLAKENKSDELKAFIRLLVEVIREVALCVAPFMPGTASSIMQQVGGEKINKGSPLFPRIDTKNPAS